jgi:phosphatidylinositol alpha-1,6-mannosyltransferase
MGCRFGLTEVAWSANPIIRNWCLAQAIRHALRDRRVDIVYVAHWRACAVAMRIGAVGLRPRPTYIQAVHGSEVLYLLRPGLRNLLHRWLFSRVTSTAACFIALGSYQVHTLELLGTDLERVFVSPEGVDLSEAGEIDPGVARSLRERLSLQGKRVILTVGRLVERKGHDNVIRALPAIIQHVPDAIYLIVGTGPNEHALKQLAVDVGVQPDRVRFCGYVSSEELTAYYSICDVFVMPNREVEGDIEGFGIVFLEAGAQEKPCIGGQSGGAGDAIIDGKTGILVNPYSPSAIANAVVTLLKDRQLSSNLGTAARHRIEAQLQYQLVASRILDQCISFSRLSAMSV